MNIQKLILCGTALGVFSGANNAFAQEEPIEEVVVTGVRASLQRSLDTKREADGIVDAINAEELGKFPDQNVAESLQRITGVAITRSRGGEGELVTVRGLGEAFNAVTFNNRLIATENAGREFSFDVIASELISAAQVYKTPTASQGDGSVGGRVNVKSAKPLDKVGPHFAGTIATQYDEISGDAGPKFSAIASNTWADDTIGLLGSFTYSKRDSRTDVAESIGFANGGRLAVDASGSVDRPGDNIPQVTDSARLSSFAGSVARQERERTGATLAFQYAPNDESTLTLDALYTKLESPSQVSGYSFFPAGTDGFIQDGSIQLNNAANPQVVAFNTVSNLGLELVSRENVTDTDTIALGANWEVDNGEGVRYSLDASYSKAEGIRDNVGSAANSGAFFVSFIPQGFFTYDFTGGTDLPNITYTGAGTANGTLLPPSQIDANDLRLTFARNTSSRVEDEIIALRGDVIYQFDNGTEILFGADYTDREKSNSVFQNVNQCALCASNPRVGDFAPDLAASYLTPFSDDFLGGVSGNLPRVFPVVNVDVHRELFDRAIALGATAPDGMSSALLAQFDPSASNVLEESVLGAYVQVNLAGELGSIPFQANAGVRFAYTDLTSSGSGQDDGNFSLQEVGLTNQNINAPTIARVESNDYFDVLPSFNISFDINENLIARAAFSRSLSRPTLSSLSTTFSVTSTNRGSEGINAGNPLLEPVRSNNFDVSLEYYGDDGLSLSAAVFRKDVTNFISNQNISTPILVPNVTDINGAPLPARTVNFLVSQPTNGDSAEINGIELAAQKLFENGFGIAGNLTLTDSELTSAGVTSDLEDVSDLSYNASVFYEANGLLARISLNHRGDFLDTTAGEGGFREIVDDFSQLDISLSYDFTDRFTVFIDGINLLDEPFVRFSETSDLIETYEVNGARYLAGFRGSF